MHPGALLRQTRPRRSVLSLIAVVSAVAAAGCGAVVGGAGLGGSGGSGLGALAHPPIPTLVLSLPGEHTGGLISDGAAPLAVHLSGPRAAGSPRPRITPAVAGHWADHGSAEVFTPDATIPPCRWYALTVPARTRAKGSTPVPHGRSVALHVPCPSVTGLQRTLAALGYLPYTLHRRASTSASTAGAGSPRAVAEEAFNPSAARLTARYSSAPKLTLGSMDQMTTGALMAFQSDHNMNSDGAAGASTWDKLLSALNAGSKSTRPYTWVTVSKSSPETLEVHRNGHTVFSTPANTGVSGADTASGTFPIFSRSTSTTMTGTNPDGSHYSDPGVPWVNYFNGGDAVHGFNRGSYGSPQSNGCVELAIDAAAKVYPMLNIGDLVIVS